MCAIFLFQAVHEGLPPPLSIHEDGLVSHAAPILDLFVVATQHVCKRDEVWPGLFKPQQAYVVSKLMSWLAPLGVASKDVEQSLHSKQLQMRASECETCSGISRNNQRGWDEM